MRKIVLLIIVLIFGTLAFLFLTAKEAKTYKLPFINQTITIQPTELDDLKANTEEQLATLTSRASIIGEQSQDVLGTAIQVDTASGSSMTDKAIDYGRYLYCQQVVDEYKKQYINN